MLAEDSNTKASAAAGDGRTNSSASEEDECAAAPPTTATTVYDYGEKHDGFDPDDGASSDDDTAMPEALVDDGRRRPNFDALKSSRA